MTYDRTGYGEGELCYGTKYMRAEAPQDKLYTKRSTYAHNRQPTGKFSGHNRQNSQEGSVKIANSVHTTGQSNMGTKLYRNS